MSIRVNLLPRDLQRRRRQRQRRRFWIGLCLFLAAVQVGTALLANFRVREVRTQQQRINLLQASLAHESMEREALQARAKALAADLKVAESLREKHYWSRWLGNLSLIAPSEVVLTELKTEPSRFAEASLAAFNDTREAAQTKAPAGVRVVRVAGAASEHGDLISLLEQMNRTRIFRSVRLEEARRDKMGEKEMIGFTLVCEW
ncbi:MAG TPA: PilN domain-containing protein [Phycisphaerae bacterium]|nr:PilN domain-containing protein [Phycisphaerae bacterium]